MHENNGWVTRSAGLDTVQATAQNGLEGDEYLMT